MKAGKLLELARWADPDDDIVVEVDGYEFEPVAVESDEYDCTLRLKCVDFDSPSDDDDEESCADVCALPERATEAESLEPELVEG